MVAWAICLATAGGLMSLWALGGSDQVSAAASVLGTVTGLLGILAVWAWRGKPHHASSDSGQITETAHTLARMVRRQWEDEAVLRQLFDPAPLPVAWAPCRRGEFMDRRMQTDAALVCHAHDPDELIETFQTAAAQRIVVLGPAGSGKTTFAVLLLLALLRTRAPGDPVPVLCPLASFDPSSENARDWLQRRVTEDYPALSDAQRYGTASVVDLLTEQRLVPVLDGLDEVPPARRAAVLAALNDTLPLNAPLVLTCRTDDYARAVRESAPLANATVLEPVPLRIDESLSALRLITVPERRHAWDVVAERLAHHPDSPVARVLISPLMATMVRSVYAAGDRDPVELTDPRRFPTVPALEHHLLDALIPTLYERSRRQDPTRRWGPERAQHYLTFLADGMSRQGTFDLAWWQLHTWSSTLAKPWRRATAWFAVALIGQLVSQVFVMLLGAPWWVVPLDMAQAAAVVPMFLLSSRVSAPPTTAAGRTVTSASVATSGGLTLTLTCVPFMPDTSMAVAQDVLASTSFAGLSLWLVVLAAGLPGPPDVPSHGRLSMAHWRRRLPYALVAVVCVAVSYGLLFASYAEYGHRGGEPRFLTSLRDGLVIGVVLGVGLAFFRWVRAASADDSQETVEGTLHTDRLLALLSAGSCALLFVLPESGIRNYIYFTGTLADLPAMAAARLLAIGAIAVVLALATRAWPYYVLARFQFAVRGQLPWRLQEFLADAHRLGILRRVSSTYQFRHARLQSRLAQSTRLPEPRTPADPPGTRSDSALSP